MTKQQLPAARRGTWVSGTKGNGIFRYNDSAENRLDNLVGKEARYENDHIAVGGFPQETYHGGNADAVKVGIPTVTGFNADNLAADAAMREKLGDPDWKRPEGYVWNHAGGPESKTMELVDEGVHGAIAHKGPAAVPRAIRRIARTGGGAAPGAMGALTAYMTARDALQAARVLKPDYDEYGHTTYHFIDKDGSDFIVVPGGWFSSPKREFVDGPRKGQSETITNDQVEAYRKQAEHDWGKLVPGSLLRDPRFIPGKKRKTLPLMIYEYGVPHEAGWIDEEGVHRYSQPRPAVI
ncbi:MAG TPA: HNH endonuclease [Pirellulales bacterium]|nr:HNH endonuclease [Pirellulales bacterium]